MIATELPPGDVTVLMVGAHPDDIEIGCGATILALARRPATTVHFATLTGTPDRRREGAAAAQAFFPGAISHFWEFPDGHLPGHWAAVKDTLQELATAVRPQLIFSPRRDDAHQDHRLAAELVPTVWRDSLVLEYEIPKWDGDLAVMSAYWPASPDDARRKVQLLGESYPSQLGHDWWDAETYLGLMRIRGVECRNQYAEAFVVRKSVLGLASNGGDTSE